MDELATAPVVGSAVRCGGIEGHPDAHMRFGPTRVPTPPPAPGTTSRRARLRTVRVLHPFPSLLVTGVTLAVIPLADAGSPWSRYIVLGVSMLCFQFGIGVVNDIVDAPSDAVAKPWKPIPSGLMRRDRAVAAAAGLTSM